MKPPVFSRDQNIGAWPTPGTQLTPFPVSARPLGQQPRLSASPRWASATQGGLSPWQVHLWRTKARVPHKGETMSVKKEAVGPGNLF